MTPDQADLTAYVDGAARGNPGDAAIGVVLLDGDRVVCTVSHYIGKTTNNVAEYRALLAALEAADHRGARSVHVFTDSELMARQWSGRYRVKNAGLKPLYATARQLASRFDSVTLEHIPRERNARADRLCNQALDSAR